MKTQTQNLSTETMYTEFVAPLRKAWAGVNAHVESMRPTGGDITGDTDF